MSNIIPNTRKLYMAPNPYSIKEKFVFEGRRYFLLDNRALVSDYGKYGMLPPEDKGFYLEIPKGDFKKIKARYIDYIQRIFKATECGYLKSGGEQLSFDF